MTKSEINYLTSCELVVSDLENHVKQCEHELSHYNQMVKFMQEQLHIATTRLHHEKNALAMIKQDYEESR